MKNIFFFFIKDFYQKFSMNLYRKSKIVQQLLDIYAIFANPLLVLLPLKINTYILPYQKLSDKPEKKLLEDSSILFCLPIEFHQQNFTEPFPCNHHQWFRFWNSILLEHFIKHRPLISEGWDNTKCWCKIYFCTDF